MFKIVLVLCVLCALSAFAHPTMYKLNENSKLEPDLIPVSSTVIPLPVYQVGYGIKGVKSDKNIKPDEPLTLITVHTKKKAYSTAKIKQDHISTVKEVKN